MCFRSLICSRRSARLTDLETLKDSTWCFWWRLINMMIPRDAFIRFIRSLKRHPYYFHPTTNKKHFFPPTTILFSSLFFILLISVKQQRDSRRPLIVSVSVNEQLWLTSHRKKPDVDTFFIIQRAQYNKLSVGFKQEVVEFWTLERIKVGFTVSTEHI